MFIEGAWKEIPSPLFHRPILIEKSQEPKDKNQINLKNKEPEKYKIYN
jgi:hypothetical protein